MKISEFFQINPLLQANVKYFLQRLILKHPQYTALLKPRFVPVQNNR